MSTNLDSAYGAWISRIFTPLLMIVQLSIIYKSIKNRKRIIANTENNKKNKRQREIHHEQNNLNISDDHYEKWLNLLSLSSMILFTCCSAFIIIFKTPVICKYFYALPITCYFAAQCTLTMYQICRLQYCFASQVIQQTNYSYPKWIFIILYGIGISLTIYIFISIWFVWDPVDIGIYGCILKQRDWWKMDIFAVIPLAIMWIWDIIVLLLYVFKIYQLTNMKKTRRRRRRRRCSSSDSDDNDNKSTINNGQKQNDEKYAKINFILKKIVGLTVAYEIKALITGFVQFGGFKYQSIIANTTLSIDVLLSIMIIYLMIEHNNDSYIAWKNKCDCCTRREYCCCGNVVNGNKNMNKNKDGYMNVEVSMDNMNNNVNNNDLKIVLTSVIAMDSTIDESENRINHDVTITEI